MDPVGGGCSWIYVLCLFLIHLSPLTVRAVLTDDFVLFADGAQGKLYQVPRDGGAPYQLNLTHQVAPVAVEYDPLRGQVYWSDVNEGVIRRADLQGRGEEVVIRLTPGSQPEGLALDAVERLLFYTDNGRDVISVLHLDRLLRRSLVGAVRNPRAIQTDPIHRHIYWSDWGLQTIERASYDGSGRIVLISLTPSWINGIALDLHGKMGKNSSSDKMIYWTDAHNDVIQRASLAAPNNTIETVVQGNATLLGNGTASLHFYSVAVGSDHVYFSDWELGAVLRARKQGGSQVEQITQGNFVIINGVVVYESAWYTRGMPSECAASNGGCSHLCLPTQTGRSCSCPDYQTLGADNTTCVSSIQSMGPDLLWVEHDGAGTSHIRGIRGEPADFLLSRELKAWNIRSPDWHWTALGFDYSNRMLYLADRADKLIMSLSLNSSLDLQLVHHGTSAGVQGLAVDWVAGNLYWTDATYNWIMLARAAERTKYVRRLVTHGVDDPHGIATWPQRGLLVWTDWGGAGRISVCSLAGDQQRTLVSTRLNRPTGLAVDFSQNRVFWANEDSLESISVTGTDRQQHGERAGAGFYGLARHQDFLFVTDQAAETGKSRLWFYGTRQGSPYHAGTPLPLQWRPYDVIMYHQEQQPKLSSECPRLACSQLCVTLGLRAARCLCADGYTLAADGRTCAANASSVAVPTYIYSLGDRLCARAAGEAGGLTPLPPPSCFFQSYGFRFEALAYDWRSGNLYFSETRYHVRSIRRAAWRDKTNNEAMLQGVGEVKGLAVDYVSRNLYWTDATYGQLWVCRLDGRHQRVLLDGLRRPAGVATDLLHSYLYWIEQGDENIPARIRRSRLTGDNPEDFVTSGLKKPTSLDIDYTLRRLYWADPAAGGVGCRTLEAGEPCPVLLPPPAANDTGHKVYGLAVLGDYLAYTEWHANNRSGLHVVHAHTGAPLQVQGLHDNNPEAFGVIAYSDTNQPTMTGPCQVDNGGCAQLCLPTLADRVCQCVNGQEPDPQRPTSCRPVTLLTDQFFLVADDYRFTLYQTGPDMLGPPAALTTPPRDRPIGVEYDFTDGRVYWSDFNQHVIKRMYLNGSDVEVIRAAENGSRVDGLALDPLSRLLYYTDTDRGQISVQTLDGRHRKLLVTDLPSPRGIALNPQSGHMFYTVRDVGSGRVERRDLAGLRPHTVVQDGLSWPTGLTIDTHGGALYWCDSHTERIETSALDGTARRTIFTAEGAADPFGITHQGAYVYWTDWSVRGVFRVRKDGWGYEVLHSDVYRGLNDVMYFDSAQLPGDNVCSYSNGNCSHLCLAVGQDTRVCACPDLPGAATAVQPDGHNCPGVETCPLTFPGGQIRQPCHLRVGAQCGYTCSPGYRPAAPAPLTCLPGLSWDAPLHWLCEDERCPLLTTPPHAHVDPSCPATPVVTDTCYHTCNPGYRQMGGAARRTCIRGKLWEGDPIVCAAISTCAPLVAPPAARLTPPDCATQRQAQGALCRQQCLNNSPGVAVNRTCLANGTWSGSATSCLSDTTGAESSIPTHGHTHTHTNTTAHTHPHTDTHTHPHTDTHTDHTTDDHPPPGPSDPPPATAPPASPSTTQAPAPVPHQVAPVSVPLAAGVGVGCLLFLALLVVVAVLLYRKRTGKQQTQGAYRGSSNIQQQRGPFYDAHNESISLDVNGMNTFENPTFHSDQNSNKEFAGGYQSFHDDEAPPLSVKEPMGVGDVDVTSGVGAGGSEEINCAPADGTAFNNPMFRPRVDLATAMANAADGVGGEQLQPDLTRELSHA